MLSGEVYKETRNEDITYLTYFFQLTKEHNRLGYSQTKYFCGISSFGRHKQGGDRFTFSLLIQRRKLEIKQYFLSYQVNPDKALNAFLPSICRLIMALTENPEVAEDENIDNELLFNMLLLSEVNNSIPTFVYIFFLEHVYYGAC